MPGRRSSRDSSPGAPEAETESTRKPEPVHEAPPVSTPRRASEVLALQRTIGNRATTQVVETQLADVAAGRQLQRAVPTQVGLPKPEPEKGNYRARGGQTTPYSSAAHPRATFSFGSTRDEVLSAPRNNPVKVGDRIVSVRDAASGQQVNVEGVQLDHSPQSWANISSVMDSHNAAHARRPDKYTLWDARMYYHDVTNLQPVLGSLNAAAGKSGVTRGTEVSQVLSSYVADVQTAWMNLQQGLSSAGANLSYDDAINVGAALAQARDAMNLATEAMFGGKRSIDADDTTQTSDVPSIKSARTEPNTGDLSAVSSSFAASNSGNGTGNATGGPEQDAMEVAVDTVETAEPDEEEFELKPYYYDDE